MSLVGLAATEGRLGLGAGLRDTGVGHGNIVWLEAGGDKAADGPGFGGKGLLSGGIGGD